MPAPLATPLGPNVRAVQLVERHERPAEVVVGSGEQISDRGNARVLLHCSPPTVRAVARSLPDRTRRGGAGFDLGRSGPPGRLGRGAGNSFPIVALTRSVRGLPHAEREGSDLLPLALLRPPDASIRPVSLLFRIMATE